MKYEIYHTSQFKKSFKLCVKRGYPMEELSAVITKLADDIPLEEKLHDHEIAGQLKGIRECHIRSDWLLEYKKTETKLILTLIDTGTHSDLFKK